MNISNIKLECADLQEGHTKRYRVCPCPEQKKDVFTVTRNEGGLLYNCFSAGCSERGACGSRKNGKPAPKTDEPQRFNGALELLPSAVVFELEDLYEIPAETIRKAGWRWAPMHERLYFPLYNLKNEQVGEQLKAWHYLGKSDPRPKSHTYKWADPLYHATSAFWSYSGPVVLVEDPISALKMGAMAKCVALLGTHLPERVVRELLGYSDVSGLICMLDPDTWEMAVNPARLILGKYRCLFPEGVRILRVDADPKSMREDRLKELLSG